MNPKCIVVAGGVISGVGKGVTTASLGKIIKEYGYRVTLIKIDPYINYDAGTLRPTEHGEVWVTHDGGEIDQDLGTYERFLNQDIPKKNNITTGQIYKAVIDRERRGEYLGQTVQFIPHIIDEIKARILHAADDNEIVIIELGGTVGDYENAPYLHAIKALEREWGPDSFAYVLVTYLPIPDHVHEMKTKPTQQAIRQMGQEGIFPDFIVCRAKQPLDTIRKKKIEVFANIRSDHIISAPDITTIYQVPLNFQEEQFGQKILNHFKLTPKKETDWTSWRSFVATLNKPKKQVKVGIIGKYFQVGDYSLTDSYLSIYQALIHAGVHQDVGVTISWINAHEYENNTNALATLQTYDGIIIPGGFGTQGVDGKLAAISYIRTHEIPYLGICYGMQLAAIEFARSVGGLHEAHTTEIQPNTPHPIIDLLPMQHQALHQKQVGGSMRLGGYQANLKPDSRIAKIYKAATVIERHRHRYEMNPSYVSLLEKHGLNFSGRYTREDGTELIEFLELESHPFFIATQAHPEFTSRLDAPNPLFMGFIQACNQRRVSEG